MAAYNGAPYIREQVDSILKQTDKNWLLTISDDGSTDGTDAIIDEYAQRYPDRVRRVRSGRRFGEARAHFFWLMANTQAAYVAFCDDDDVWNEDKLKTLRQAMEETEARRGCETPVLIFSDQTVTNERLDMIAPSLMRYQKQYFGHFDYRSILMQNVVTGGAMMINRALAKLARQCADPMQAIMHDWWTAAVAARFGEVVYIDEPLGAYRQHGHNSVGAKNVGSLSHVVNRLSHLDRVRNTLAAKKAQARMFSQSYLTAMDAEDMAFLNGYSKARSGPLFYLKYRSLVHGFLRLAGMMVLG